MSGILFAPRISMRSGMWLGFDPNSPVMSEITNEGSYTCNACSTLVGLTFTRSAPFTCVAVPVKLFLALGTKPVITSASDSMTSDFIVTSSVPLPTGSVWVFMPIIEKGTCVSSAGTRNENVPSAAVEVPRCLSFIEMTDTPTIGLPASSLTTPDTVRTGTALAMTEVPCAAAALGLCDSTMVLLMNW